MKFICPVCGYDELSESPYDSFGYPSYEICSCCGFEYGYDDEDLGMTFNSYRERWIENGAKWFNEDKKPEVWSLSEQLKNLDELK